MAPLRQAAADSHLTERRSLPRVGNRARQAATSAVRSSLAFAASKVAVTSEERDAAARDRALGERLRLEGVPATIVRGAGTPAAELSLVGWTAMKAGERREVTLDLRHADGILGLDLALTYDATRLAIVGVRPAGIGSRLTVATGDLHGTYRIAAYDVVPLAGSGPVLTVTVEALSDARGRVPPAIGGTANEGAIPLRVRARAGGVDGVGTGRRHPRGD